MNFLRGLAMTMMLGGSGALAFAVAYAFFTDPSLVRWTLGFLALLVYTAMVGGLFVVGVRAGIAARSVGTSAAPEASAPPPGLAAPTPAAMQAYMAQTAFPALTPAQWQNLTRPPAPAIDLHPGVSYPGQS